jgi:hypothetical protein
MVRIQLTQAQIRTIHELISGSAITLNVGPVDRSHHWKSTAPRRSSEQLGDIQVSSDTGIAVVLRANDGQVAEIGLGSYLNPDKETRSSFGSDNPENRFRVAWMALRYPGNNFGEVCRSAGGTQDQFNNGWMPSGCPALSASVTAAA